MNLLPFNLNLNKWAVILNILDKNLIFMLKIWKEFFILMTFISGLEIKIYNQLLKDMQIINF